MARKYAVRKRGGETECRLNTRLLEDNMVVQIHAEGNKVKGRGTIEHSSHTRTYDAVTLCAWSPAAMVLTERIRHCHEFPFTVIFRMIRSE
jgi:hypothetical protein